ncbi:hypothetical protein F2P79_016927 [Pimephales promelas]|nr:hypothetical protein F2P79_016927 [Pimephales promelas]
MLLSVTPGTLEASLCASCSHLISSDLLLQGGPRKICFYQQELPMDPESASARLLQQSHLVSSEALKGGKPGADLIEWTEEIEEAFDCLQKITTHLGDNLNRDNIEALM